MKSQSIPTRFLSALFISLSVLASACQSPIGDVIPIPRPNEGSPTTGGSTPVPIPTPVVSPSPIQSEVPVSVTNGKEVKVTIQSSVGYSSEGLALLEKARSLLERVVNSEEFKQQVVNHTYGGKKTYVMNNDLSNEQIYAQIMSAAEQFPKVTAADQNIDLHTELYTSNWFGRNTIGYTNPSTSKIYVNTYFFYYADASAVAGNLMHEWLHKLGFDHDYNSTASRPYSVPYAVGYIAEELVRKIQ
jgi:hypothetical protein